MSPKRTRKANELPYIPLGPFQWRIPGIHYKLEYVEFFQGLILGATALSSIPYLTDNLGLPYELAWSCVIIEVFMYMLHGWLGDPVVPGWITPTLPFTLAYLNGFPKRTGAYSGNGLHCSCLLHLYLYLWELPSLQINS